MTAPLTPESEAMLSDVCRMDMTKMPLDRSPQNIRKRLAAIEAAAIARYAEGLVQVLSDFLLCIPDGAIEHENHPRWQERLARRLLAIPEAQEADRG
jgi:Ser/Thr protein kinase RdoA (MazF antagonist)